MAKPLNTKEDMRRRPWRSLYDLAAWQSLRARVIRESHGICESCGAWCTGRGQDPAAPTVDHIRPHRGDRALFLDRGNLQLLCKRCHDGRKAREEARGHSGAVDADGWPVDPRHPANARR